MAAIEREIIGEGKSRARRKSKLVYHRSTTAAAATAEYHHMSSSSLRIALSLSLLSYGINKNASRVKLMAARFHHLPSFLSILIKKLLSPFIVIYGILKFLLRRHNF
jgi:hypothetical protein